MKGDKLKNPPDNGLAGKQKTVKKDNIQSINSILSESSKRKGNLETKFKQLSDKKQAEFLNYFWEIVGIGMKLQQENQEQEAVIEIVRYIRNRKS